MSREKRKPKAKPLKKTPAEQRRAREATLIDRLCGEHGYMMQDAPKRDRVTMMRTVVDGKARIEVGYRIYFIVPADSAVGRAFAERYQQNPKARGKKS